MDRKLFDVLEKNFFNHKKLKLKEIPLKIKNKFHMFTAHWIRKMNGIENI